MPNNYQRQTEAATPRQPTTLPNPHDTSPPSSPACLIGRMVWILTSGWWRWLTLKRRWWRRRSLTPTRVVIWGELRLMLTTWHTLLTTITICRASILSLTLPLPLSWILTWRGGSLSVALWRGVGVCLPLVWLLLLVGVGGSAVGLVGSGLRVCLGCSGLRYVQVGEGACWRLLVGWCGGELSGVFFVTCCVLVASLEVLLG